PLGLRPEVGQEAESDLHLDPGLRGEACDRALDVAEVGNVLAEEADPLRHAAVLRAGGSGRPSTSSSTALTCQRPRLAVSNVRPRKARFVGWQRACASGSATSVRTEPSGVTRRIALGS